MTALYRKPLAIASSLMLILFSWLLTVELESLEIQKHGQEVQVRIIEAPDSCEAKSYFSFEYLGEVHVKRLSASQCEHVLQNDFIVLKTDNERSNFLFTDEDVTSEIGANILLILFSIFCLIKGLTNKKTELNTRTGNYRKVKKPLQPKMGRYGNKI